MPRGSSAAGKDEAGADSVILLELGRLVWSGPRHSLQDQQLAAIFLGSAAEAHGSAAESADATTPS